MNVERIKQIIALGAGVIVAIQTGIILFKGTALCPNAACELVEAQTTITPLGLNILGFVYFLTVFWMMRRQARSDQSVTNWVNLLLLAGLAAEAVLFSFQLFVVKAFCGYCLLILVLILAMNILSGTNQMWRGAALTAAVLIGFSVLRFNPVTASFQDVSLEKGIYGTRTCVNPSKQIYLIFSEDCPHCIQVINALEGCNSCELHLNPIDPIDDSQFRGFKPNAAYSTQANRTILSMFGIDTIPVLLVENPDGFQFIRGTQRIIDYIHHACFMQEPTLYLDRSQFPDQEHITAFSLDEGECSVEIDCDDVEESFESKP